MSNCGRRAGERRRRIELTLVVGLLILAPGCGKPLLSPRDERSPYDRYDAVRNQFAQQYSEDKFGQRKPNLRERLTPRE